ncbi:MAG: superoxide dismutase [Actinobacteria bacterium]|nr:superoxide dismutase [Actinomycetota bacterium]
MGIARTVSVASRTGSAALFGLLLMALALGGSGALADDRPKVAPLPDGFQPEGIATRDANSFFVGSIPTGAIYRGDLKTGEGSIFVPAQEGRNAIGLSLRNDMLFVAGGPTGQAYVYDASTGAELAMFQLVTGSTFVNDVVATKTTAYFTDSVNPSLYKVPIQGRGEFGTPEAVPLTGDLVYEEGFNANGIDATPDGKTLVVVQSNTGRLFTVNPQTGGTTMIDLGGETVTNGDGILLDGGRRLWVLQNRDNLLTLVRLEPDLRSGDVTGRSTDETFDVPTTLARAGDRLAVVNARFGTESAEAAEYWVTQIRRPR